MTFSHLFRRNFVAFGAFRGVETPGRASVVCVWQEKEKKPSATEFTSSSHRVRVNLGAERGESRFKGEKKGNRYLFGKDRKKGGVRTAIESFPVRVCPERGAETPETRLRGIFREALRRFRISA